MQWAKQQQQSQNQTRNGFTIVELLIVVVVIAVLAAITIVSYNGITQRAKAAVAQGAVDQAVKKLAIATLDDEAYPSELRSLGLTSNDTTKYQYSVNNTTTPAGYCVTATVDGVSYRKASNFSYAATTLNEGSTTEGRCPGHGAAGASVTNLVTNPSTEVSISGQSGTGGGAVAQSGVRAVSGSSSLLVTLGTNSAQGNTGARFFVLPSGYLAAGMKPSTVYTVTAYVYVPASTVSVQLQVTGAGRGAITAPASRYSTVKDQWQRLQCTITTAATDGALNMYIMNNQTTPGSATQLWADSFMVYEGSATYQYGDGSTSDWVWSGTTGLSTSWGPAI
jgi:prepilin-type N-terminal cleavage/methylation domain-containing protein